MPDGKRLLLTGATGFVGTNIAPMLAGAGWTVVPGKRDQYAEAVAGCEAVVHLAGRAHVMRERDANPAAIFEAANVDLTVNLARGAAKAGVRRFVFMSTAKVFGEGRDEPYSEADVPFPQGDYARTKLEAEEGLFEVGHETGLEVVVLRPPLIYGPGVRANFLGMMQAVDRGLLLPIGAIRNRRSLVSVTNLGSAVIAALDHPQAAGKVFAVTDGDDVSTPELVRRIATALGKKPTMLPVPLPLLAAGATALVRRAAYTRIVGNLALDSSLIRNTLGWVPVQPMAEGLAETASWYRQRADAAKR